MRLECATRGVLHALLRSKLVPGSSTGRLDELSFHLFGRERAVKIPNIAHPQIPGRPKSTWTPWFISIVLVAKLIHSCRVTSCETTSRIVWVFIMADVEEKGDFAHSAWLYVRVRHTAVHIRSYTKIIGLLVIR